MRERRTSSARVGFSTDNVRRLDYTRFHQGIFTRNKFRYGALIGLGSTEGCTFSRSELAMHPVLKSKVILGRPNEYLSGLFGILAK